MAGRNYKHIKKLKANISQIFGYWFIEYSQINLKIIAHQLVIARVCTKEVLELGSFQLSLDRPVIAQTIKFPKIEH